jgi:hypothetical protein
MHAYALLSTITDGLVLDHVGMVQALEWIREEMATLASRDTVDAELREAGLDPDEVAAHGRAVVRSAIEKHKAREGTTTMRDEDIAALGMAQFELDATRASVEDLWRAVYGDSRPLPARPSVAARKLLGPLLCVDWSACQPAAPPKPPRRLPLGVVRDDGDAN